MQRRRCTRLIQHGRQLAADHRAPSHLDHGLRDRELLTCRSIQLCCYHQRCTPRLGEAHVCMRSFHLSKVHRGGLSRNCHSRWLKALIDLNARASVLLQRLNRLACVSALILSFRDSSASACNTSTDQWCRARCHQDACSISLHM
jgi:hypothetical protein